MADIDIAPTGILIAESNSVFAGLVADMARGLGRRDIVEAYDARSARTELARRPFAFLVLDDDLKDMDGVTFTRRLRTDAASLNRSISIIMISATPDAARIAQARDAGVTEFLRKPFAASHLETRLLSIEAKPRDFVETRAYIGPDRRRRTLDIAGDDRTDDKTDMPKED